MSFLRWCELCLAEGIKSSVCQYRVTSTEVIEMCQRLECCDLIPQIAKLQLSRKASSNRSEQAATAKECQASQPSTSFVPEAPSSHQPCKATDACAVEGALSSSTKEAPIYASDSTSAESLKAISAQATVQGKKRKKKASHAVTDSVARQPLVHVCDSTSSEAEHVMSGQVVVQGGSRKESGDAVEVVPSSFAKESPVYVSDSSSSEFRSAISGQEVAPGPFIGTLSLSAREHPVATLTVTSEQDTSKKEISASGMVQLGNTQTAKCATSSVTERTWSAAVALVVSGETAAEGSDFVSVMEDRCEESKQCKEGAVPPVSDHSRAMVEPTSHTSCLPDRNVGSTLECITTVNKDLLSRPPTSQEKEVGLRNLERRIAAVDEPAICDLPCGEGTSLRQSPAKAGETSSAGLTTTLQTEQETSKYSMNSSDSILTEPSSDVQCLPKESDLPKNVAAECELQSLKPCGPSENDTCGIFNSEDIPSCEPNTAELDLQANCEVESEPLLESSKSLPKSLEDGQFNSEDIPSCEPDTAELDLQANCEVESESPKSLPKSLEDGQTKASFVAAPMVDHIGEESSPVRGKVSLQENPEVNSKTPSVDTFATVQQEKQGSDDTIDHHSAVDAPYYANKLPGLPRTSVVSLSSPAKDSFSAALCVAESMAKMESSQRKAGCHDSASVANRTIEASLTARDEVNLPENAGVNSNTSSAEAPRILHLELGGTEITAGIHSAAGVPRDTSQVLSQVSSASEASLLVSDEDSLSATLHIAETMSTLAAGRPRTTSTAGSFQEITPPSATAATIQKTADLRSIVGMPVHSGKGRGTGQAIQGDVVAPLAGILSGLTSQAGMVSSDAVPGQPVVLTATNMAGGAMKVQHIVVTLPARTTVAGGSSRVMQNTNTRAEGVKRPLEIDELSPDFISRLNQSTKRAMMRKLAQEGNIPVSQFSIRTRGETPASMSSKNSIPLKQVGSACKGKQAALRSRQPAKQVGSACRERQAATQNRKQALSKMERKQVSSSHQKHKLLSKHPEHVVPDVLHPVPSPLSSELSSTSSKPSNDGSSGPSDNRSSPYLSAKLRSTKSSNVQSSSTYVPGSAKEKFLEKIQSRVRATSSASRLPGYHSALASRPPYKEVPVITSKRNRTVDSSIGDVDLDLDHYVAKISTAKDLEQYKSVLSDLFESCA